MSTCGWLMNIKPDLLQHFPFFPTRPRMTQQDTCNKGDEHKTVTSVVALQKDSLDDKQSSAWGVQKT